MSPVSNVPPVNRCQDRLPSCLTFILSPIVLLHRFFSLFKLSARNLPRKQRGGSRQPATRVGAGPGSPSSTERGGEASGRSRRGDSSSRDAQRHQPWVFRKDRGGFDRVRGWRGAGRDVGSI